MEIILRLNGIAVVEEGGLYRIIPIGNISKEPAPIRFGNSPDSVELKGTAILQVVPLTFVNSTEMANILTPLLTQGGAIHDIVKRNMLIIADTDANVRRLLQVISMFDIDTYKDASRSKIYVYPLQNSKTESMSQKSSAGLARGLFVKLKLFRLFCRKLQQEADRSPRARDFAKHPTARPYRDNSAVGFCTRRVIGCSKHEDHLRRSVEYTRNLLVSGRFFSYTRGN